MRMYCITCAAIYNHSLALHPDYSTCLFARWEAQQPARPTYLDVSKICGMPLRPNVVVLQDPCAVEIMHVAPLPIVLVHAVDFIVEGADLVVCVSALTEAVPQAHQDDLRIGVDFMHLTNEGEVRRHVLLICHRVSSVVVVGAEIDNDNVGWLVFLEVPGLRVLAIDLRGAPVCVTGLKPLVSLATRVAPAVCVVQTDTGVCCDAELDVAEASADFITKT